jgi:hypothetical protein
MHRLNRSGLCKSVITGLVALIAVLAAPAAAQETGDATADARAHFEAGVALAEAQNWTDAAREFGRSVELLPTAPGLLNLGFSVRNLGRNAEAMTIFQRFVREFGDQANPADLQDATTQIAELRALVAEVRPRPSVEGADVTLDGGAIELAQPLFLEPGTYTLSARLENHQPAESQITVAGGDAIDVPLELLLVGGGEPVGPGGEEAGEGVDPLWFWVTGGTAVALAIGAGVTGGLAISANDDYAADPNRTQSMRDEGMTLAITADVLGGIAGAAAVAAVVLVFFTDWGGEESPSEDSSGVAVTPTIGTADGGMSLGVVGRF